MKKILLIATGAAALCTSAIALAATPGYFVGGQLGYSKVDLKNFDGYKGKNETGLGYGAYTGYNFDQNFGLQLGYNRFSSVKYKSSSDTFKFKIWDVDLLVNGYLPLNDQFELFAKAGVAYVKVKDSGIGGGSDSAHRYRPKVVLGGSYDYSKNLSFDVSYSRIFKKGSNPGSDSKYTPNLDMATFGVTYTFPNEM